MSYICPHCISHWRTTPGGYRPDTETATTTTTTRGGTAAGGARCVGKYEWRAPNRILVMQLGTNEEEATVFRAHAVRHRLCEILINALKLPTNQQRDGHSPIQSTVTGLREKSRERITNDLTSFVALDNRCAVEVGHLREGQRLFSVKKNHK